MDRHLINLSKRFIEMVNAFQHDDDKTFNQLLKDFHTPFGENNDEGFNFVMYDGSDLFFNTVSVFNILYELCYAESNEDLVEKCKKYVNLIINDYDCIEDHYEKAIIPDLRNIMEKLIKLIDGKKKYKESVYSEIMVELKHINQTYMHDCLREMVRAATYANNYLLIEKSKANNELDIRKLNSKIKFMNNTLFYFANNLFNNANTFNF